MMFYVNRDTGSVLLAYYDTSKRLRIEYFGYHEDHWIEIPATSKTMNQLREAIDSADRCDIIIDDGEE